MVFLVFLFACQEKKIENKTIDNQIITPKTPFITLSRDSALRVWRNLPISKDTVLAGLGIAFHLVKDYPFVLVCRDNIIYIEEEPIKDSTRADLYIWYTNQDKMLMDSLTYGDFISPLPDDSPISKIIWQDIDFDGQQELLLQYYSISSSRGIAPFRIFKYDKVNKQLNFFIELYSNSNIAINNQQKTITLYEDDGRYIQTTATYQWQADTLQMIKRREVIWVRDNVRKMESDSVIFYELKNNKLVVVKQRFANDRHSYDAVFYDK